jgi:hypothetical protein
MDSHPRVRRSVPRRAVPVLAVTVGAAAGFLIAALFIHWPLMEQGLLPSRRAIRRPVLFRPGGAR